MGGMSGAWEGGRPPRSAAQPSAHPLPCLFYSRIPSPSPTLRSIFIGTPSALTMPVQYTVKGHSTRSLSLPTPSLSYVHTVKKDAVTRRANPLPTSWPPAPRPSSHVDLDLA